MLSESSHSEGDGDESDVLFLVSLFFLVSSHLTFPLVSLLHHRVSTNV